MRPPEAAQQGWQGETSEQVLDRPTSGDTDVPDRHERPVAQVNEEACTPCGACQSVCPTEAITLGEMTVRVKAEVCCGCGACVDVCPNGAITMV